MIFKQAGLQSGAGADQVHGYKEGQVRGQASEWELGGDGWWRTTRMAFWGPLELSAKCRLGQRVKRLW